MKKNSIAAILALITLGAVASNNYLLTPGDFLIHKVELQPQEFAPGKKGLDVQWDFATENSGTQFIMKVQEVEKNQYHQHFPKADIVVINEFWTMGKDSLNANYHYYGAVDGDLVKFGRIDFDRNGKDLLVNEFDDPELLIERPLSFLQASNDYWSGSFYVPSLGKTIEWNNGISYYEVDGEGTLNLLGHQIDEVYRVKRERLFYEESGSSSYQMSEIAYEWYHPNYKFPIASLIQRENGKEKTTTYHAYYIDEVQIGTLGLEDAMAQSPIQDVFPNPSNGLVNVSYHLTQAGNVKISIVNAMGQRVQMMEDIYKSSGIQEAKYNLNLNQGMYFVQVETEFGRFLEPLIIS